MATRLHIDDSLLATPREQWPDSPEARVALARPCTFGTVYEFYRAGEALAEHSHTDENCHFTVVACGGVHYRSRAYWAPAVIDCRGDERHGFVALADNTVIVNVRWPRG